MDNGVAIFASRRFKGYVVIELPSETTMSTIERVRACRSKGLALAAVIAGVGRYLGDIFRPEDAIPPLLPGS